MTDLLPTWRLWLGFVAIVLVPWVWFGIVVLTERIAGRREFTLTVTDDTGRVTQLQPIE